MPANPNSPQAIAPTEKEQVTGVYGARNLQKVLGALHQDGLVVLRGVIDPQHIDQLNEQMCTDAEERLADPNQPFNQNVKCETSIFSSNHT